MKIENGIHTFSLRLQCKYSEIQNIVEQNECICTSKDKFGLSRNYRIATFAAGGVKVLLNQSLTHPCWLTLIVNPSSLLAGTYLPTTLFNATGKNVRQVKRRLRDILDAIGVDERLHQFRLSRCDLTRDQYCESGEALCERLDVFRKSLLMPRYRPVLFNQYTGSDTKLRGADRHSWTIQNKSRSCAFSVYDKTYELKKRHDIAIPEHILRMELRFCRAKITKATQKKDWCDQLVELGGMQDRQMQKFLHRLHQNGTAPVTLGALLARIDASPYREKTKKKLRRIAKKACACVSLAAVQRDCRIRKSDFIKLLARFDEMEVCCVAKK